MDESLDLILQDNKSVIRFGDGEFDLIRGASIPYQTYDSELANRLKDIILGANLIIPWFVYRMYLPNRSVIKILLNHSTKHLSFQIMKVS
ncbi:DUF1792 domain-containing protein [Lactobacillus sp. UMNPBX19]|nr:DUF1792 domain-containing protein [Lactobacillus sp. UMNPBX19]